MKERMLLAVAVVCFALVGCAAQTKSQQTWHVGVGAPEHYGVIVDQFKLIDSDGGLQDFAMGAVECCWKGDKGPRGKGGPVTDLPTFIGLQWYSLAERKIYRNVFALPENLKKQMLENARYATSKGVFEGPRDILTVGLAPGGTIVIWIQNQIGNEVEVARIRANEIGGAPNEYRAATRRYLKENEVYLDNHGIPTVGW